MAVAEESSVFFVPGICSQYTICPRQQAHVFLPVLPSLLLVWTTAGEELSKLWPRDPERVMWGKGGLGNSSLLWALIPPLLGITCQDAHLCFLDFALRGLE